MRLYLFHRKIKHNFLFKTSVRYLHPGSILENGCRWSRPERLQLTFRSGIKRENEKKSLRSMIQKMGWRFFKLTLFNPRNGMRKSFGAKILCFLCLPSRYPGFYMHVGLTSPKFDYILWWWSFRSLTGYPLKRCEQEWQLRAASIRDVRISVTKRLRNSWLDNSRNSFSCRKMGLLLYWTSSASARGRAIPKLAVATCFISASVQCVILYLGYYPLFHKDFFLGD